MAPLRKISPVCRGRINAALGENNAARNFPCGQGAINGAPTGSRRGRIYAALEYVAYFKSAISTFERR
jgi:hypothetical protein